MAKNRGFTIIEMLIVLAVSGILILVIFSFIISGFDFMGKGQSRAEIQSNIRLAERIFRNELRNAQCVKIGDKKIGSMEGKECNNDDGDVFEFEIARDDSEYYYLSNKGRKITEDIFSDIKFSTEQSANKINFALQVKGDQNYKIGILLNNFTIENTVGEEDSSISLSNSLDYKLPE
ncbi:MAG: PilW family protein [Halanaerobiaceae bacterium]